MFQVRRRTRAPFLQARNVYWGDFENSNCLARCQATEIRARARTSPSYGSSLILLETHEICDIRSTDPGHAVLGNNESQGGT